MDSPIRPWRWPSGTSVSLRTLPNKRMRSFSNYRWLLVSVFATPWRTRIWKTQWTNKTSGAPENQKKKKKKGFWSRLSEKKCPHLNDRFDNDVYIRANTYGMTPKSVIDSWQIDGQQTQRYAEQVERQKTMKVFLGLARKRVIHGRWRHTDLKNTI